MSNVRLRIVDKVRLDELHVGRTPRVLSQRCLNRCGVRAAAHECQILDKQNGIAADADEVSSRYLNAEGDELITGGNGGIVGVGLHRHDDDFGRGRSGGGRQDSGQGDDKW